MQRQASQESVECGATIGSNHMVILGWDICLFDQWLTSGVFLKLVTALMRENVTGTAVQMWYRVAVPTCTVSQSTKKTK